jgi:hypothetical protein
MMQYSLPAQIAAGHYKVLRWKNNFRLWLCKTMGISVLSHVDLLTTGALISRVLRNKWCPGSAIETAWSQYRIFGIINVDWAIFFGWFALFLQPCFALACSIPFDKADRSRERFRVRSPYESGELDHRVGNYSTFLFQRTNFANAVDAIARACRFECILARAFRAQQKAFDLISSVDPESAGTSSDYHTIFKENIGKFVVFNILETGLQPILQAVLFHVETDPEPIQPCVDED